MAADILQRLTDVQRPLLLTGLVVAVCVGGALGHAVAGEPAGRLGIGLVIVAVGVLYVLTAATRYRNSADTR